MNSPGQWVRSAAASSRRRWRPAADGHLLGGLILVLGVLLVTGLLRAGQSGALTVPVAGGAVCALLFIAWRWGFSWADLGMARADVGTGIRWGAALVAVVAAGCALAMVIQALQPFLTDGRTPTDPSQVALRVLVLIPLRTVLIEEVAFRGVLWRMISKARSPLEATIWSSVVFGIWHIPPALLAIRSNDALSRVTGGSAVAEAGAVLAIVILTGLCGVVFAELRRRSGSLVAPACLHWAANGFGTLASSLA